jgi:hypothetical protein
VLTLSYDRDVEITNHMVRGTHGDGVMNKSPESSPKTFEDSPKKG